MSVASIGECMLELSGSDGQHWRMGFAGDTFNTLWTLRALTDMPCDYVSAFGDDPFSAQQIAFMANAGIGIAASPAIAGARPGLYAITLDGAERSFTYWRSDAAARRLADDATALATSLARRKLIYLSGITLATTVMMACTTVVAQNPNRISVRRGTRSITTNRHSTVPTTPSTPLAMFAMMAACPEKPAVVSISVP